MKTKLNMHNTLIKLVFLGLIYVPILASGQEEEVILSSASMKEAEEWNTRLVVKPKYRYVDSLELKGMLSVALQPNFVKFPGDGFWLPWSSKPSLGLSFVAKYERFIAKSSFAFFAENTIRLYKTSVNKWDYRGKVNSSNNDSRFPVVGERHEANIYSLDLGFKYYFRLKNKVSYGASGVNQFNDYLFVRFKDVVNYTAVYELTTTAFWPSTLMRRVDSKEWIVKPSYVLLGYGLQRRIKERGTLDVYLGAGVNLFNNREHYYQDVLIEVGVNIGVWFGKKRWKQ